MGVSLKGFPSFFITDPQYSGWARALPTPDLDINYITAHIPLAKQMAPNTQQSPPSKKSTWDKDRN